MLSALLFLLSASPLVAQKASFIYIQGDKKTPFYVKMDGEMLPRYGKNYCIIPELTSGVANIEVLFQQNAFPAQKFAIRVPENGERGFLIVEKRGEISLYDINQEFYLPAGNKAEQDRLPQNRLSNPAPVVSTVPKVSANTEAPKTERRERNPRTIRKPTVTLRERPAPSAGATTATTSNEPRFIPNLSLDTSRARADRAGGSGGGCGEALDVQAFAALYRDVLDIADQDERLVFLNKQSDGCFSPTQLRLLTRVLDRDAARFTFLKNAQSRITVSVRFADLEALLTSEAYKARFRELAAQP